MVDHRLHVAVIGEPLRERVRLRSCGHAGAGRPLKMYDAGMAGMLEGIRTLAVVAAPRWAPGDVRITSSYIPEA